MVSNYLSNPFLLLCPPYRVHYNYKQKKHALQSFGEKIIGIKNKFLVDILRFCGKLGMLFYDDVLKGDLLWQL